MSGPPIRRALEGGELEPFAMPRRPLMGFVPATDDVLRRVERLGATITRQRILLREWMGLAGAPPSERLIRETRKVLDGNAKAGE